MRSRVMRLPFTLVVMVACSSPSSTPPRPQPRDATLAWLDGAIDALGDPRRWFAGDVHMHVAPVDPPGDVMLTVGQIADAARTAGLDFVVLTPHLWTSRWTTPADRTAWRKAWLQLADDAAHIATPTMIPGVEWSTRSGHFTVAGADLAALDGNDFLAAARAAGAYISANHPFAVPTKIPGVRVSHFDISYRVWSHRERGFTAIDGAEVFNAPLALANLISTPGGRTGEERAWTELDRIARTERRPVSAVGGTDNHRLNVMATTWVLAADASADAILAALRAGATCVGGPEAGSLRARGNDGDWVAIGGTIRGPTVTLAWDGTARLFVDDVDRGEYASGFVHDAGAEPHTYRIVVGPSRSGFVYANL